MMTCQRNFPCLKLLAMLLSSFHTMGANVDNTHVHIHLSPQVGFGQANTNRGLTTFDNTLKIDQFFNSNARSDSSQPTSRVGHLSDTLFNGVPNSNTKFQNDHPETSLKPQEMIKNVWDKSRTLQTIQDTAFHLTRQLGENKSDVEDYRVFPGEFVKLKLPNVREEIRNRYFLSQNDKRMDSKMLTFSNPADGVSSFGETNIKSHGSDLLKKKGQRKSRTRFPRDIDRGDFLERSDFKINGAFPGKVKPEIDFGIDLQNDGMVKWLDDLGLDERFRNVLPQMLSDTSLETPPEVGYEAAPDILDSEFFYEEHRDDHTDQDNERSLRNMLKFLLQPLAQPDDSSRDNEEDSSGVGKRDSPHIDRIYELIRRRDRPNRVRIYNKHEESSGKERPMSIVMPSNKVGFCEPEIDGTQPMRCPSDTDRCLYDSMICDGNSQCPKGEDEAFPLCVLRHWTDRLMRKFIPS